MHGTVLKQSTIFHQENIVQFFTKDLTPPPQLPPFLGHVNDLHTWQFPTDRPADRPTDRPREIKSSDWSKVGMLYRRGGH